MQSTSTSRHAPSVLVIAPGMQSRGGIDAVVRLHQSTALWRKSCTLLSTYDDRSSFRKIVAALKAYLQAPFYIIRSEIVHIHLAGEISLMRKLFFLVLTVILRRKLIVHIHAYSLESFFVKTPRLARNFVLNKADRLIVLSPRWAAALQSRQPKVVVLPNPVCVFDPAPRRSSPGKRILFVGKLEPRKGFDTLLDAASIVLRQYPDTEFWFAGNGNLTAAHEQSLRLGISERIHLLDWQSAESMQTIYHLSDLFCLPSHDEGVPMSMLEAMSHGLPVVCTPVGGIPDVVVDGANALYATPGDPQSVASAILRIFNDPSLADRLAFAGRETVLASFRLEEIASRLETIYESLIPTTMLPATEVLHDT